MRVISDLNVLRQFERRTATVFSLLQNVVSAVGPLDANKLQDIVNELTIDRFNLAQELLASAQAQDVSKQEGQKNAISRGY